MVIEAVADATSESFVGWDESSDAANHCMQDEAGELVQTHFGSALHIKGGRQGKSRYLVSANLHSEKRM